MTITEEQFAMIARHLPRQRGNVGMGNRQMVNAILYVAENGCKWRALPESFGNWHVIFSGLIYFVMCVDAVISVNRL